MPEGGVEILEVLESSLQGNEGIMHSTSLTLKVSPY